MAATLLSMRALTVGGTAPSTVTTSARTAAIVPEAKA